MADTDCTILVCSCDKYADLLEPFAVLWRKYWPDCPFETVLVTETKPDQELCFSRVVACGKGGNWCSRLVEALETVETPYILMLCDDYFLASPVDTEDVLRRLGQAKDYDAANLRLIPNPVPGVRNSIPAEGGLFEYRKNTAYCIATQAGIWNREFLLGLARGKSSIWEFERSNSPRADKKSARKFNHLESLGTQTSRGQIQLQCDIICALKLEKSI